MVLVFVDQKLKRGGKTLGSAGNIGIFIDHKYDSLGFCQFKNIFKDGSE